MNKLLRFTLCAGLVLLSTQLNAAIPQTISYQGYLTNSGGTPISGTVAITFRLYNAARRRGCALYRGTAGRHR